MAQGVAPRKPPAECPGEETRGGMVTRSALEGLPFARFLSALPQAAVFAFYVLTLNWPVNERALTGSAGPRRACGRVAPRQFAPGDGPSALTEGGPRFTVRVRSAPRFCRRERWSPPGPAVTMAGGRDRGWLCSCRRPHPRCLPLPGGEWGRGPDAPCRPSAVAPTPSSPPHSEDTWVPRNQGGQRGQVADGRRDVLP